MCKMKSEHRVALGVELAMLSLVVAWAVQLLLALESTSNEDAQSLRSLLGVLTLLLLAAGASALLSPTRLPEQLRSAFRSAALLSHLCSVHAMRRRTNCIRMWLWRSFVLW